MGLLAPRCVGQTAFGTHCVALDLLALLGIKVGLSMMLREN